MQCEDLGAGAEFTQGGEAPFGRVGELVLDLIGGMEPRPLEASRGATWRLNDWDLSGWA